MSTQPRRVSSETPEPDLQIAFPRQRLKLTVNQSGPVLLAGGFGILVLLIFITGLGVVSRATLLFRAPICFSREATSAISCSIPNPIRVRNSNRIN